MRSGYPSSKRFAPGLSRRAFQSGLAAGVSLLAAPVALAHPAGHLRFLKVRHGCFLIDLGGLRVLVDPWFSRPPADGVVWEAPRPALSPQALGRIDVVLVTCEMWDRADIASLLSLHPKRAFCFTGAPQVAKRLRQVGFRRVREVRAGDVFSVRGLVVEVSAGADRRAGAPSVGYRLRASDRQVWITGALAPLDVDDRPFEWIRGRPCEVVFGAVDRMALGPAGMRIDDALLLARLAHARFLVPALDGLTWVRPLNRWLGAPAHAGPMRAGRVLRVDAELGVWNRVVASSGQV